jgi:REP element-mobilizing transposase RayT
MPQEDLTVYRRWLPHWRQAGAVYFVTWRLAPGRQDLSEEERAIVAETVCHFDGAHYQLSAFVVMNDHVHVLVKPSRSKKLQDIVHSWKSFSTHRLQHEQGRVGSVWQSEYFDRIVRDQAEFVEKATYILHNPRKRWPDQQLYPWVWVAGHQFPWG